ncbi:uncharacterized protein [Primulina eburnea]|uniref:uncharacterized protein n=1 Tax=Primulina eburnea TaxID=1245227 RepID=UPI003C6C7C7A
MNTHLGIALVLSTASEKRRQQSVSTPFFASHVCVSPASVWGFCFFLSTAAALFSCFCSGFRLSSLHRSAFVDVRGTSNNAGAILVLGRDLVVVPKLIHQLPPAISSPETSPECHIKTRRCRNSMLTEHLHPTRGRPQAANDRVICT